LPKEIKKERTKQHSQELFIFHANSRSGRLNRLAVFVFPGAARSLNSRELLPLLTRVGRA
jgi:hypothetical protein